MALTHKFEKYSITLNCDNLIVILTTVQTPEKQPVIKIPNIMEERENKLFWIMHNVLTTHRQSR
jgi:hypothetical protein